MFNVASSLYNVFKKTNSINQYNYGKKNIPLQYLGLFFENKIL